MKKRVSHKFVVETDRIMLYRGEEGNGKLAVDLPMKTQNVEEQYS